LIGSVANNHKEQSHTYHFVSKALIRLKGLGRHLFRFICDGDVPPFFNVVFDTMQLERTGSSLYF
jgi:hypothetical protein